MHGKSRETSRVEVFIKSIRTERDADSLNLKMAMHWIRDPDGGGKPQQKPTGMDELAWQ